MPRARSFRLTAPVTTEQTLHETVADALDKLLMPPAEWTTFPAGSVPLPPQFAAKLSRLGLKRGWPDVLVLHSRIIGIELKRRGGRLSRTRFVRTRRGALRELAGQEDVFPRLQAAGMTIGVCSSLTEVLAFLGACGVPLRVSITLRNDRAMPENGNAVRGMVPAGVQREQCDGQDRTVPAANSGGRDPEGQDHPTSAVGQRASPVRRASSRPSDHL